MINPDELQTWLNWFKRYYRSDDDGVVVRRMIKELSDIYAQGYKVYMLKPRGSIGKLKVNLGNIETYNENDRREHYTIKGCSLHIHSHGAYEIHGTAMCGVYSRISGSSPHPNVSDNRGGHICQGNATYLTELSQDRELAMLITTLDEFARQYSSISPYWRPRIEMNVCEGCEGKGILCAMCMCTRACPGAYYIRKNRDTGVTMCRETSCTVRKHGCIAALETQHVTNAICNIREEANDDEMFMEVLNNSMARSMVNNDSERGLTYYITNHATKTDLTILIRGIHDGKLRHPTTDEGTDEEQPTDDTAEETRETTEEPTSEGEGEYTQEGTGYQVYTDAGETTTTTSGNTATEAGAAGYTIIRANFETNQGTQE